MTVSDTTPLLSLRLEDKVTRRISDFRSQFPSLNHLTYLNSGSYGLLANDVAAAFQYYLDTRIRLGADWGGWVTTLEDLRAAMARLFAAAPDEVAITGSATAGFNAVASALRFDGPRNRILVTDADFPTGAQIWHAQEPDGADVVHVPEGDDGRIPLQMFDRLIDDRTKLVALSQVCYRHGARLADETIRSIAQIARGRGALVLLDCYQIVGTAPIKPHELGVDFLVGGMLKYLVGTAGIGFLWVRPELIEGLVPLTSGWFAQADVEAMDISRNDPSPTARRFEGGTPPVPNLGPALAGVELILKVGLDEIERQVRKVTSYALAQLEATGIAYGNPRDEAERGPLISIPARDDNGLVAALGERGIVTSCRDGRVRAGFHAYNVEADVDRLVEALNELRPFLA